jgi:hypothetical protein
MLARVVLGSLPPTPNPPPGLLLVAAVIAAFVWWDASRTGSSFPVAWAVGTLGPPVVDAVFDPFGGAPGLWLGLFVAAAWLLAGRWAEKL